MQLPGSPFFSYEHNTLCVDGLPLAELAQQHGTPLFVYSQKAMLSALAAYQQGLQGRNALICYAVKANSALAILQLFARAGCGFDTVSGGEIQRALHAGAQPETIIFSGVGKTAAEMRFALNAGIGCFNVESHAELDALNAVAMESGRQAPVSIRVNPDVDAKTHPYISTGLTGNKFGIAHTDVLTAYRHAASLPGLKVIGIDCHIGSQITDAQPYLDAVERLLDLVQSVEAAGIALPHLDFGGGLGIVYENETPPAADTLLQQMLARLDARGMGQRKLLVEPGRSLVGNAGACVSEVLYLKHGPTKNFCIVDAAMNDLPRPAMYQARHAIAPVRNRSSSQPGTYDVVGPVCESGDWLGRDRQLDVRAGDLLAVMSAGAYCMSMASNYNSRCRAAEVLVADGAAHLIADREKLSDILARERLL